MTALDKAYLDTHELREAFFGNRLSRLVDLIVEQGEDLFRNRGLSLPSTSASTVLYLSEHKNVSAADVARDLNQPHQLATQRVQALLELGLVERSKDPNDGRRNVLALTENGKREARKLRACLADAARVYEQLSDEIGIDVSQVLLSISQALADEPLLARVERLKREKIATGS